MINFRLAIRASSAALKVEHRLHTGTKSLAGWRNE